MTDFSQQYFTIESLENGNVITLTIGENVSATDLQSVSYSIDNGANWITTQVVNSITKTINVNVNRGEKILWKGTGNRFVSGNATNYSSIFTSTKTFNVYGNIMSLIKGDNFANDSNLPSARTFNFLFYNANKLVDASNFMLTPTTMTLGCYMSMFRGCSSLTKAPSLPATTLAQQCYWLMFVGCTSLIEAPELPATTLANSCYATMFDGCTSLVKAPELPATTLNSGCYGYMFRNCSSLTEAPFLPANTLAETCYQYMFYGCTALKSIKCLATDISATNCTQNWVQNVSATGTFYKHPSMTGWGTGNSGIPSGWTTKDYMMLTVNGNIPAAVKFVQNGVTHDLDYLKFGNNLVWQKTS